MHVSAAPVLLLILFGFIGIKHIYTAAVNPSILTVMALIALTSVLKKQIRLDLALSRLGNSPKTFLISTTTFTALLSALVNNTPVVALLVPVIKDRAKKMGWSSKKFPPSHLFRCGSRWNHYAHWYLYQHRAQWYEGGTLLHNLETVHISADHNLRDCRFPVQTEIRPHSDEYHDFRGYAGRIAGGV